MSSFIESTEYKEAQVLYRLYYEQKRSTLTKQSPGVIYELADPSLDLAFDDTMLDEVKASWEVTMRNQGGQEPGVFMQFEERNEMNGDDDDDGY